MKRPHFSTHFTLLLILIALQPGTSRAWGPEGHLEVGKLAFQGLDPTASAWLHDLLASDDVEAIGKAAYPPGKIIQADFAKNSWLLIRQQWLSAGNRLARILNAVVGEGEVELKR